MEKSPQSEAKQELTPKQLDSLALASMQLAHHDEMVAYRADGGINVMRFIETGQTDLMSLQLGRGGPTYSQEVRIQEPIIDRSYDSIGDYVATLKKRPTPATVPCVVRLNTASSMMSNTTSCVTT